VSFLGAETETPPPFRVGWSPFFSPLRFAAVDVVAEIELDAVGRPVVFFPLVVHDIDHLFFLPSFQVLI